MEQQEARDILKGCEGCLLFLVIFWIAAGLWFTYGLKVLTLVVGLPIMFIYFCGPYIVLGLLGLLVICFIVFMIKVILKAIGII